MYEFVRTGQLLPILIGTNMEDPGGSGLLVPVLGVEKDKLTGKVNNSSISFNWLQTYSLRCFISGMCVKIVKLYVKLCLFILLYMYYCILLWQIKPLGGSMEHPEGTGLVPITIGVKAVDPVTAELSPVTGVRSNPETGVVVPVTLASGGHKKRKAPLGTFEIFLEIFCELLNNS